MSQAKVDRYKEYKANKEKIIKKEKMVKRLEIAGVALIAAAFIGWVGYSFYAESDAAINVTEMDTTAIDDYVSGLSE